MRKLLIILLLSLALLGCITQKAYPTTVTEKISQTQSIDLDKDGTSDLVIYDFVPVKQNNLTIKRQVAVAVLTSGEYTAFKNISDIQLIETRSKLDEFDSKQKLAFQSCAAAAGLKQDCTVLSSCSVLCSGSFKCKRALDKYPTAVPAAMIDFVDDRNEIETMLLDVRNGVLNLGAANQEQKADYLQQLRRITFKFADAYSNPLYTRGEIALCTRPGLDLSVLEDAGKVAGSYSSSAAGYRYYVTVLVSGGGDAGSVSGVELVDQIPATFLQSEDDISSRQTIEVNQNGSMYAIGWKSERSSDAGYMFGYRFSSSSGPEKILPTLSSPVVKVNLLDATFLALTDFFFGAMYLISGNFFIALGASIALTLVVLALIYNLVVVGFHAARAKLAGESPVAGVRKALGGTELRWKSDAVLGVVLLAAGYYISVYVVSETSAPITLMGAFNYFTSLALSANAAAGLAGVGVVFLGVFLIYSAIENKAKIFLLERAYGVVIKEEKDLFVARVSRLKEKMKELQKMVEQYSSEEFDVSQEYDVLTSLSAQRIDELSKKMSGRSKRVIEEDLNKVEGALERLSERKKLADESWPKWMATIDNILAEHGEVYLTSLITIPASLRAWALRRYVKERGAEGIVFERDSIKRRKVTPEDLLKSMISNKLILGAIVFRKDQVLVARMEEGAATVPTVLSLRLRSYMRSLAKSLGQHEPVSFASVGGKNVLVMMKVSGLDSFLIIPRQKFKEAVDVFKKKAGMLG